MASYSINNIIYNLLKIKLLSIIILIYISMRLTCPLAYNWRNPSLGHARLQQVGAWQRKVSQIAHIHMHYCQRIHTLTTRSKYQGTASKNSAKKKRYPIKILKFGMTNQQINISFMYGHINILPNRFQTKTNEKESLKVETWKCERAHFFPYQPIKQITPKENQGLY